MMRKTERCGPRDLESDADDGGRPPPHRLHAVAEAAAEHWDREHGHDAAEEDEHLKKEEKNKSKLCLKIKIKD